MTDDEPLTDTTVLKTRHALCEVAHVILKAIHALPHATCNNFATPGATATTT